MTPHQVSILEACWFTSSLWWLL